MLFRRTYDQEDDAFVHAYNQGAVGRVQIKPHDVAHLVDEEWIAAELEGRGAMRREREGAPDAADLRLAESGGLGHVARRPVRGTFRPALQRAGQHLLHLPVAQLARSSWERLIQQPIKTAIEKTL